MSDGPWLCEQKLHKHGRLKPGLKRAYYDLLLKFAKFIRASYLVKNRDDDAAEIDKFVEVLKLNKYLVYGDAMYVLNRNRLTKLRRPEALPSEEDVGKVKEYTVNRIKELVEDPYRAWDCHSFGELRDLTASRLTLFNARRGGEPARLSPTEWEEADEDAWLNDHHKQPEDELEKKILQRNESDIPVR